LGFFDFTDAIVRAPGESAVQGLCASGGPAPSLPELSAEHETYVKTLESLGLAVERLEPAGEYPDSMFVEDPALVFPEGAILLRPGATSRAGESGLLEPVLRRRFDRVLALDEGCADGGDVLVTPDLVLIGRSKRTDEAGARRLTELLAEIGRKARIVATPAGTLHLKSDCALIDQDTILATPALAASGAFEGFRVVTTPEGEEKGANLVRIGNTALLGLPWRRTADLILSRGVSVRLLPTFEIAKIDAGLSCMSLRW
jgi:dimethylargininase